MKKEDESSPEVQALSAPSPELNCDFYLNEARYMSVQNGDILREIITRLRTRLAQAERDAKEYRIWANCGGVPCSDFQCTANPKDIHQIYGCAYGQEDGSKFCELHEMRKWAARAERAEAALRRAAREFVYNIHESNFYSAEEVEEVIAGWLREAGEGK
jgi:hypothetical protein